MMACVVQAAKDLAEAERRRDSLETHLQDGQGKIVSLEEAVDQVHAHI